MTPGASLSREKGRRGARRETFCPCRRLLWYHPSERSESALNHHISRRLSALGLALILAVPAGAAGMSAFVPNVP